ncbi:hypothetical protein LBMAG42_23870 [Deltaproteobacteria bacterium]|nr:hypothetical protein LBMAG42_23870 [Deltaproteobacteria bacterium]
MRLLLLVLLLATPDGRAVDVPPPQETIEVGVSGTAPSGLTVHADLRDEYLRGLPIVVEIALTNNTAAVVKTPDLAARRHLVHFQLVSPDGKTSERFSTPPQFDTGGEWTIAPKATRSVLLEVPSSAGFALGDWKVNVMVGDGAQAVVLPAQKLRIVPPNPVAGDPVWEPTIEHNSGALVPWVHKAKEGYDLYVNQYAAADGSRLMAHYRLLRSPTPLDPVLSRGLPNAARSRWMYWLNGADEVRVARLEGSRISGVVRPLGTPWPKVELLARGVSDAAGNLLIPLWIPAPKGPGGGVRVLTMTERGAVTYRVVAELAQRPPIAETGVDANGNMVVVLGHDRGLDVYRLDAARAEKLPAEGARAWKAGDGWTNVAAAFDVLPDKDGRAGGLAILAVQRLPGVDPNPAQLRTLRVDLAGKLFETGAPIRWAGPATMKQLLPAGYAPFHYVSVEAGVTSFGASDGAPILLGKLPEAEAWPTVAPGGWRLRWLEGAAILAEKVVPTPK